MPSVTRRQPAAIELASINIQPVVIQEDKGISTVAKEVLIQKKDNFAVADANHNEKYPKSLVYGNIFTSTYLIISGLIGRIMPSVTLRQPPAIELGSINIQPVVNQEDKGIVAVAKEVF